MAAPTYVNHTTDSSLTSPITGTKPTGTLDGHLLLAHLLHVTGNLAVDPTAPSGWTLVSPGRQAHSSSTSWYYWKIAASEPATWQWSHATSDDMIIGIVAISGVDQTTPLHQTHLLMDTNIGSTTVALTVTTTLADCLLVAFAGQDQTVAGNTWSQASMTERYDQVLLASLLTHCMYTETAATATTYNRTITASTAQRISGALIAVAPAATATDLVVQNATQAQTANNATLTQVHNLAIASATQAQSADSPTLTQVHNLTVAGATQGQAADNVTLNVATNLVVADAAQAQTAQQVTLTQAHNLTTQNAAQAQTADNVALTQVHSLAVQGATQEQAAGSVILIQTHVLTVQGSTQAQTSTTVTLGTEPVRDITVVAGLRNNHVTGGVSLTGLVAGLRSNHITGGVGVPRDLYTGSVEYISGFAIFEDETAASIATATGVVQFTTNDTVPAAGDPNWVAPDVTERTDVNGGAKLTLKRLHTAGVAGEYRMWAKVSDNPEVPILKCGTFTVR